MPQLLLLILVVLSIAVIIKFHRHSPPNYITLLLFSVVISYVFSRSIQADGMLSLFFPPYGLAVVLGWNHAKYILNPFLAAAFTFISEVITDITWAAQFGASHNNNIFEKISGVGGAGWGDGIVIFPLTAFFIQLYCLKRNKLKASIFSPGVNPPY